MALRIGIGERHGKDITNDRVQATKWLMVRPNLQYVKYPGGLKETNSAVVGGVQFIADF